MGECLSSVQKALGFISSTNSKNFHWEVKGQAGSKANKVDKGCAADLQRRGELKQGEQAERATLSESVASWLQNTWHSVYARTL